MTESRENELKPADCPFCGSGAAAFDVGGWWRAGCSSIQCGISTGSYAAKKVAVTAWNRRALSPPAGDGVIKHMVDRFLSWKLPENFRPDAGISFKATWGQPDHVRKHEPSGTNLFDAAQAEAMVRYMIDGMPITTGYRKALARGTIRKEGRTVAIICNTYEDVDSIYRILKQEGVDAARDGAVGSDSDRVATPIESPTPAGDGVREALEAARRIVDAADKVKGRPTVQELEAILAQPDGPPVHINPDGSIGAGTNDALIVARSLLSPTGKEKGGGGVPLQEARSGEKRGDRSAP